MFTTNTGCRICGSKDLRMFLDLSDQPPANSFISEADIGREQKYPLKAYWCARCNLAQLIDVVDKDELFKHYVYFSSGMPKLSDHFQTYAEGIIQDYLTSGDLVVEVASNDGILLRHFKEKGFRVRGVDPAENIAPIAEQYGVPTHVDYFSEALANSIRESEGPAKAILANNVVAHINDHHDLARAIRALLDRDGVFVMEAPYLVDMFDNLSYDTIYHEHLSFLSVRPLATLFAQYGLEIFDVQIHPVQGQSIRVFVGHAGAHAVRPSVQKVTDDEVARGFNTFGAYQDLAERVAVSKTRLVDTLSRLKTEGKRIAGYGAPAKGNTLLNYCGIGRDILEYAVDDLPSKQNLVTPGMHVPVISRAEAESRLPDVFLLLAWNYKVQILEKEKGFKNKGGVFVMPIGNIDTI